MQDYEARPPIETSLFPSDQAVLGDLAVKQILSSQLELPAKGKLAILKFPDAGGWGVRAFGGDYWRNEEYLKFQQGQVEMVSGALLKSEQIAEVIPMPSLMTPKSMSIPVLREAAVRMQADLLLVFRISSDTYSQYRLFAKDKVKAYSTCEFVLLDVRTGLVPFTRVISRERMAVKQPAELNVSETMRRAEQESASEALRAGAENLVGFVKSAPKRRE
ncbi:MAG: hypothetical protein JWQ71_3509 [Pedosphaera sp.]|nr:hypothetical protein [Pedosphaera sp.]